MEIRHLEAILLSDTLNLDSKLDNDFDNSYLRSESEETVIFLSLGYLEA